MIAATVDSVTLARQHADDVEWSAEDATRSDIDFLCRCCEAAIRAGATTINLPDTVGYALPEDMERMFTAVRERVPGIEKVIAVHPQPQRPGAGRGQHPGGDPRRRASGGDHHQRHRRACRQRLAGRDRDGDPHPPGRHSAHEPDPDHQSAARVEAARRHHRLRRAAEQGDRRAQRLRARGRHPSGRRAEACRHLRDHDPGKRRLGEEQPGARQAFRPRRVPRQAEDARLPDRRQPAQRRVPPLQGPRRPQEGGVRRGHRGAGG